MDIGSTRNFLGTTLAAKLNFNPSSNGPLHVKVANENTLISKDNCVPISNMVQGQMFHIEFLLLPLIGYDAILGIQ